jgi:hypothetical protein
MAGVLGEMNSVVDEHDRYVKGLMPRVEVR